MRYKQYLAEAIKTYPRIDEVWNHIERDCTSLLTLMRQQPKPFYSPVKGVKGCMYRGMRTSQDYFRRDSRVDDRQPKDMPSEVHQEFNRRFALEFGWPVRNGVFTTTDIGVSSQYGAGESFIIFIPDPLEYVWSPNVPDLWVKIERGDGNTSLSIKERWKMENIDFDGIINEYLARDLASALGDRNEIIFNCKMYYCIRSNRENAAYVLYKIWG